MNKVYIAGAVTLCIITVGIVTFPEQKTQVVADNATDTQVVISPVIERTLEIYDSKEFQDEMKVVATARAMFELSNETQKQAINLSEQAVVAHAKSVEMSLSWRNSIDYASTTE